MGACTNDGVKIVGSVKMAEDHAYQLCGKGREQVDPHLCMGVVEI
jgi:hypothetical protein